MSCHLCMCPPFFLFILYFPPKSVRPHKYIQPASLLCKCCVKGCKGYDMQYHLWLEDSGSRTQTVCAHMPTSTCLSTHQRPCTHTHPYTDTHVHACMHTCIHTLTQTHIHTHNHACTHACMHACMHTHTHTHRETDRHTHTDL